MNLNTLTFKHAVGIVALIGLIGTCGSFFAQYVLHLNPCPLCIFQRVAVFSLGLFALLTWLFLSRGRGKSIFGAIFTSLPALFGLGVALRQIYIQHLPPSEVPACGPGLNFMAKTLPFQEMVAKVLTGSGECAKVETILAIPLPVWSTILFSTALIILWGGLIKARQNAARA